MFQIDSQYTTYVFIGLKLFDRHRFDKLLLQASNSDKYQDNIRPNALNWPLWSFWDPLSEKDFKILDGKTTSCWHTASLPAARQQENISSLEKNGQNTFLLESCLEIFLKLKSYLWYQ